MCGSQNNVRGVEIKKNIHSPCLLVAEFLRDHLPQIQPQSISHFLGQVVVRAPAKKHDVRHVRKKKQKLELREEKKRGGRVNGKTRQVFPVMGCENGGRLAR